MWLVGLARLHHTWQGMSHRNRGHVIKMGIAGRWYDLAVRNMERFSLINAFMVASRKLTLQLRLLPLTWVRSKLIWCILLLI